LDKKQYYGKHVGTVLSAKEDNKEEHFLEDGPVPLQPLYEDFHQRLC
jgi:hypothetical protein